MKYFLASLVLISFQSAHADFAIDDGKNLLKSVAISHPGVAFDTAFQCGEQTTEQANLTSCQVQCNNSYCESRCDDIHQDNPVKFTLTAAECTADGLWIFGDNNLKFEVTKTDYEAAGNYWIYAFLKNVGTWIQPDGVAVIEDAMPFMATYVENGKQRSIDINMIHGTLKFAGAQQGLSFELWVTNQLSGVQQILLFRIDMKKVFLQNRGLIVQY